MKLYNKTKNTLILENLFECKSFLEKTLGLISRKKENGVYFKTRFGVHSFGMKFPIDVVVLDGKNKITQIKKNLPPNRFFFWRPWHSKIIEIPSSANYRLEIGDLVSFE